jgi:hypothetical protein
VDLALGVAAISSWNRLAIRFQKVPGTRQAAKYGALGETESTRIGPMGMLVAGDIGGTNQAVKRQERLGNSQEEYHESYPEAP